MVSPPGAVSPLGAVSTLFRGVSNAFVGSVADLYSGRRSDPARRKERQLYLALLVIAVLLIGNTFLT